MPNYREKKLNEQVNNRSFTRIECGPATVTGKRKKSSSNSSSEHQKDNNIATLASAFSMCVIRCDTAQENVGLHHSRNAANSNLEDNL